MYVLFHLSSEKSGFRFPNNDPLPSLLVTRKQIQHNRIKIQTASLCVLMRQLDVHNYCRLQNTFAKLVGLAKLAATKCLQTMLHLKAKCCVQSKHCVCALHSLHTLATIEYFTIAEHHYPALVCNEQAFSRKRCFSLLPLLNHVHPLIS